MLHTHLHGSVLCQRVSHVLIENFLWYSNVEVSLQVLSTYVRIGYWQGLSRTVSWEDFALISKWRLEICSGLLLHADEI